MTNDAVADVWDEWQDAVNMTAKELDDFLDTVAGLQVTDRWGGVASIHDFSDMNAFFAFIAVTFVEIDPINFDSASEFVSTNAKCGLVKPIIDNLRDFPGV